jgi:hypothetical protein
LFHADWRLDGTHEHGYPPEVRQHGDYLVADGGIGRGGHRHQLFGSAKRGEDDIAEVIEQFRRH